MSGVYRYQRLTTSDNIRVLHLSPGTQDDPLRGRLEVIQASTVVASSVDWIALSYCWGEKGATKTGSITLQRGAVLDITPNLERALHHLRLERGTLVLWIDQISINQADSRERNQQIWLMPWIYTNAVKVVAWLGPDSPHVDRAFDVLDRCTFSTDGDHVLYDGELLASTNKSWNVNEAIPTELLRSRLTNGTQVALAFSLLLRNPWFERIWIVQEAGLASDLIVQCGHRTAVWSLFWSVTSAIYQAGLLDHNSSGLVEARFINRLRFMAADEVKKSRLLSLLWMSRRRKATDDRDKVYALAGFLSSRALRGFKIDYTQAVEDTYRSLTIWSIRTERCLDVLMGCCAQDLGRVYQLPSWANDWSLAATQGVCGVYSLPEIGGGNLVSIVQNHLYRASPLSMHPESVGDGDTHLGSIGTLMAVPMKLSADERAMWLSGIDFDVVDVVTTNVHSPDRVRIPGTDAWAEWRRIALAPVSPDPYEVEGRENAFWRTLIANREVYQTSEGEQRYERAKPGLGRQYSTWTKQHGRWRWREDDDMAKWLDLLASVVPLKRLFVTRRGYMGIACHHVQVGDKVCLLWGGRLPYLLRDVGVIRAPEKHHMHGPRTRPDVSITEMLAGLNAPRRKPTPKKEATRAWESSREAFRSFVSRGQRSTRRVGTSGDRSEVGTDGDRSGGTGIGGDISGRRTGRDSSGRAETSEDEAGSVQEPDDAYETAHMFIGGETYMHAIADGEGIAFATRHGLESRDFLIV